MGHASSNDEPPLTIGQFDTMRRAYNVAVGDLLSQDLRVTGSLFPFPPFDVSAMCKFIGDAGEADLVGFTLMFADQVGVIRTQRDMCKEFRSCTEFTENRIDAICAVRAALDEKWQPDIPTRLDMVASIYGDHRPDVDDLVAIDEIVTTLTTAMAMDEQINKCRVANDVVACNARIDTQTAEYDKYKGLFYSLTRDIRRFIPDIHQFGNRALTVGMSFERSTAIYHVAEVAIKENVKGAVLCSVRLSVFVDACRRIATREMSSVMLGGVANGDGDVLRLSKSSDTWTLCRQPCDAAGTNEYTSSCMRALTRHLERQSDEWWKAKYGKTLHERV